MNPIVEMNPVPKAIHKILGKVELSVENSREVDSYFIIQWDNNTGPITIQNRASIIDEFNGEIGSFDDRSTMNFFFDRTRERSGIDIIKNDQATFLIDILKKYGNDSSTFGSCEGSPRLQSLSFRSSGVKKKRASRGKKGKKEWLKQVKATGKALMECDMDEEDSLDEFEDVPHYGLIKDDGSTSEKSSDGVASPACSGKKTKHRSAPSPRSVEVSMLRSDDDGDDVTEESSDSDSSQDSDDMEVSVEERSSEPPSPQSCTEEEKYARWEKGIVDRVRADEETPSENRDWNELEVVTSVYSSEDAKEYYLVYNTNNNSTCLVETHEIPDSYRYKLCEFKEMVTRRKRNV
uniref:ChSh domain-containing protein n=1 Tax=Strongyloides papillosus TaxID=174720 RepID=A0A0N5CC34_STREA